MIKAASLKECQLQIQAFLVPAPATPIALTSNKEFRSEFSIISLFTADF